MVEKKKYRALVVDDDRTCRGLTCAVLNENAIVADEAESGKEAFLFCMKNVYDFIFMDIEMPEADGYRTARAVRKIEGSDSANACIVALSGILKSEGQVKKCFEAGMNDCVAKPLKAEILENRLPRWLLSKG